MGLQSYLFYVTVLLSYAKCQMLHFGTCPQVETVKFFDIERFLGEWFVIQRYPTWFEYQGHCAYKRIEACGRRIEIEHGFVKEGIQYVLKWNSSYTPGDEALFYLDDNKIDPLVVPLAIIETDYTESALLYGCQENSEFRIIFSSAWILSRSRFLSEERIQTLKSSLARVPYGDPYFLEQVRHDDKTCSHFWTAYVQGPEDEQ